MTSGCCSLLQLCRPSPPGCRRSPCLHPPALRSWGLAADPQGLRWAFQSPLCLSLQLCTRDLACQRAHRLCRKASTCPRRPEARTQVGLCRDATPEARTGFGVQGGDWQKGLKSFALGARCIAYCLLRVLEVLGGTADRDPR